MALFKNKPEKQVYEDLAYLGIDDIPPKKIKELLNKIKNEYKRRGIACFVSDFELIAQVLAERELPYPYEGYAEKICELFSKPMNVNEREGKLRKIGEEMDDNHAQILTACRARVLCDNKHKAGNTECGEFSVRYLEYAWDGIGGWRA